MEVAEGVHSEMVMELPEKYKISIKDKFGVHLFWTLIRLYNICASTFTV